MAASAMSNCERYCWTIAFMMLLGSAGCGASPDCGDFRSVSISEMRMSSDWNCFELSRVVVVARTPSAASARIYIQDSGGGDFSAIMAKCSASSTRPCPAEAAQKVATLLEGASVTVRGYYEHGSVSGFEEMYLLDIRDEGTLIPKPAPIALQVADLGRDARIPSKWFQIATVSIGANDPLVMYDFSPAELKQTGPCPGWSGFAMIPASAGAPLASACNGAASPAAISSPDPREVLIGRQFFSTFWASADCACASAAKQHLLGPDSSVAVPVRGVVVLEESLGVAKPYQIFEPLSKRDFPISGG